MAEVIIAEQLTDAEEVIADAADHATRKFIEHMITHSPCESPSPVLSGTFYGFMEMFVLALDTDNGIGMDSMREQIIVMVDHFIEQHKAGMD